MTDFPEPRASSSVFFIELDKVKPNPFQPRREFDEGKLSELAESIRQYGILQPLVVARKEINLPSGGVNVEYELIAGERRLRASRLAGLREVPALIRAEPSEKIKLELALVENVQREDLNPMERAIAFEKLSNEFGLAHKEIGQRIGKSREYVANSIRLIGLPEEGQVALREGRITESHARYLLSIQDRPLEQRVILDDIITKGLNVRETDRAIKEIIANDPKKDTTKPIDPETKNLETMLANALGARVFISKSNAGGRVSLEFFSQDELNSFLDRLSQNQPSTTPELGNIPEPQLASSTTEIPKSEELEEFTI